MKDEKARAGLPPRDETFEDLFKKKKEKHPLWSREEILRDIIRSSQASNAEYDKKAGVKR